MLVGGTYKYQGGIEVIMIFLLEILVVFVRLFSELFVEACARIWLLLCESRFDCGGQLFEPPICNVRGNPLDDVVCERTSVARPHPTSGLLLEAPSARLNFGQISALQFPRIGHRSW